VTGVLVLDQITSPEALRALPESKLPDLAAEIRDCLIRTVNRTGGHLGSNLGVVELTIALHRVFSSPDDPIIWDTGHQAYVHKLLTGRRLDDLRQAGGVSGYPCRAESQHDLVENSHASTSLSYLDGVAKALELSGRGDRMAVAVVGDGALTGGMCWEALNNIAAAPQRPVVIVLNDNGRSYAPTAGAFGRHLASIRSGSIFELLGLAYIGPVDGHNVPAVEAALHKARGLGQPVVVHCLTRKGEGYPPALADEAEKMHTIGPAGAPPARTWTDVFADEMVAIGAERPDVVAITAAMPGPTGLAAFAQAFPERAFDVGIAEQHAVTSAAGLAMGGAHPVVCIYGTFLNRAFDQVLLDVGLHRLPVTFVLDRSGITGSDGPSHHGMWDLTLLGTVPGLRVAAPRDAAALGRLLRDAVASPGPTAVRFPKADIATPLESLGQLGGADILYANERAEVLIVAVGAMAAAAVVAATTLHDDGVAATVVDPGWVLPVPAELTAAAADYPVVFTVEDGGEHGGFGDAFCRSLRRAGRAAAVHSLALPQRFLAHGSRSAILTKYGLDGAAITEAVRSAVKLPVVSSRR
jgi:1-deoxy-D-xylulose-5-phosphate synthase